MKYLFDWLKNKVLLFVVPIFKSVFSLRNLICVLKMGVIASYVREVERKQPSLYGFEKREYIVKGAKYLLNIGFFDSKPDMKDCIDGTVKALKALNCLK